MASVRSIPFRSSRPFWWAWVAVAVASSAWLAWPFLSGTPFPYYTDLFFYLLPERFHTFDSFRQGFIPLWDPSGTCGHPHLAVIKTAVFYPLYWLPGAVGGDGCFVPAGVLQCLGGLAGFWLWMRDQKVGPVSATAASLCFAGCGQMVYNWIYPASLALVPWALWAAGRLVRDPRGRSWPGLAVVLCLQVSAGFPQPVFWTTLGLGAWWMVQRAGKNAWWGLAKACGAAVLATAALWLPFVDLLRGAHRPGWGIDAYSFHLSQYGTLFRPDFGGVPGLDGVVPTAAHHFNLYAGIVPLLAVAWFLLRRCRDVRARFWFWLSLVTALLSAGVNLPGLNLLIAPGWIGVVEPARASFWVPVGLCALLGFVLGSAEEGGVGGIRKRHVLLVSALLAASLDAATVPYRMLKGVDNPFTSLSWKRDVMDLRQREGRERTLTDVNHTLRRVPKDAALALDFMTSRFLDNANTLAGISSPTGNLSVLTDNANRLNERFYGSFPGGGVWPDVAACRWVLTDRKLEPKKFKRLKWGGRVGLYENRDFLPIVRKVGFVRMFQTRDVLWPQLGNPAADVRDTVWIEDGGSGRWVSLPPPLRSLRNEKESGDSALPAGSGGVSGDWEGPNRFRIDGIGPSGGFLVWAESFEPGWRAWVDGNPASIGRAYGLFQTVRVPNHGAGRIEFRYEPAAFRLGLFVSLSALAFGLGLWILRRKDVIPQNE